jgi:hypothetical protein
MEGVMHIKNTSKYPTDEVVPLVELGMKHLEFDHSKLAVSVKNNTRGAGRAWAYSYVPSVSSFAGKGFLWLVTIRIGAEKCFPCSNIITKRTRKYLTDWMSAAPDGTVPRRGEKSPWGGTYGGSVYWLMRLHNNSLTQRDVDGLSRRALDNIQYRFYKTVVTKGPYGGKKSPEMHYDDWREYLVSTAAHEGQHIVQFNRPRDGKRGRCPEWECEVQADYALDEYRKLYLPAQQAA